MKKKAKIVFVALLYIACVSLAFATGGSEPSPSAEQEEVTLTWWGYPGMRDYEANPVPDWAEGYDFWTQVQKRTNVKLVSMATTAAFLTGTSNMNQAFSLMVASGQLPDIICYNLQNYPGGPEAAIEDGIILKLNSYLENAEHAPNLKKTLSELPELDRAIKTNEGSYFIFPYYRDPRNIAIFGPLVRKDYLDKIGYSPPETISEWEKLLTAMKEIEGVEASITFEARRLKDIYGGILPNPHGVRSGFFVENGTVIYGEYDPRFKDYLTMMNRWYEEGLLDRDFPSVDKKTIVAKFSSGKVGAVLCGYEHIPNFLKANADIPGFDVVPLKTPVLNKGDRPRFSAWVNRYDGSWSAMISAKCKHPEAAIRVLDYFYSDEGYMLCRWGTEGVSYRLVNGEPQFTELVTNNPDGLDQVYPLVEFVRPNNFPYIQKGLPVLQEDRQREALMTWSDTDVEDYTYPLVWSSLEDANEVARIMPDVATYRDENVMKFILGDRSLADFDQFLRDMKQMGIERVIEIKQRMYDAYLRR